jgi:hypothetical protein
MFTKTDDLLQEEIADIYAILESLSRRPAIDLAAALREHHAVKPTTGSEPC